MRISWVCSLSLAVACYAGTPAQAAVRLDQQAFKKMWGQVTTDCNKRLEATHLQGGARGLKGVSGLEQVSGEGGGAWRLMASGWGNIDEATGSVPIMKLPVIVTNHEDRFEFLFLGPELPSKAMDLLEADGKVAKAKKLILSERDDAKVAFGRKDGRLLFSATYAYKGDEDDAAEMLADLITDARGLLIEILQNKDRAIEKAMKETRSAEIGFLSKADFLFLYPPFAAEGFEQEGKSPEGQWKAVSQAGHMIWVDNYGDRMQLWVAVKAPELDEAQRAKALTLALALPAKDGASSVVAEWYEDELWVGMVHPYKGLTGGGMTAKLKAFIDDRNADLIETVEKTVKQVE